MLEKPATNASPPSMWHRLTSPFREFGFVAGALYGIDRVVRRLSSDCGLYVYELMVQPVSGEPKLPPNLARNLRFAEIGKDDSAVAQMPVPEHIKAARFRQGAICLGAYRKDELLGYIWFCMQRYEEDEVRCTYELADPDQSVFDFDLAANG